MDLNLIWLTKLILAHLISDFMLQKASWIADRNTKHARSLYLYWHIAITALTALVFIGNTHWEVLLVITVTHYLIDLIKSYWPDRLIYFFLDQLLHLSVIVCCWMVTFSVRPDWNAIQAFYHNNNFWVYATAGFFLTYPAGIIVAKATSTWAQQIPPSSVPGQSLAKAGTYIGIIERLIICVLVYKGQYEAIGLLITAKSILRYNGNNEEVKTEYLLVGTLISIMMAIGTGLLIKVAEAQILS